MKYEIVEQPLGGEIIKAIIKDGAEIWIPKDEANSDYQAYLVSLEESKK